MPNGLVFECYLNTDHSDHLNTTTNGPRLVFFCTAFEWLVYYCIFDVKKFYYLMCPPLSFDYRNIEINNIDKLFLFRFRGLLTIPNQSNCKVCLQVHFVDEHALQAQSYIYSRWSYNSVYQSLNLANVP